MEERMAMAAVAVVRAVRDDDMLFDLMYILFFLWFGSSLVK